MHFHLSYTPPKVLLFKLITLQISLKCKIGIQARLKLQAGATIGATGGLLFMMNDC
jgi:hypothetical protein